MIGWILLAAIVLPLAYRWQFWRPSKKGLLALMYHHIGITDPQDEQYPFTISPQRFEEQVECLLKHGFTPITTTQMQNSTVQPLPAKPVLITFDDGTSDTFETVFPILQRKNIKAVVFLITDFIGKKEGYMTWDQVRQMHQSGLVEFGSHTVAHLRLRSLKEQDITKQLTESKKEIEKQLNCPCLSFCYPFGAGGFDKRVRPLVFKAGYQFDFSTRPGINPWPWNPKKTILRAFPRGGETLVDFYIQITRGRSRF